MPVIEDEGTVVKVLGKPVQWNREHPDDPSMPGKGWYTRDIGGQPHAKILVSKLK